MSILHMIVGLRGGAPEHCDFCGKPYNETRKPILEEAGKWTCTECWRRWALEETQRLKGEE